MVLIAPMRDLSVTVVTVLNSVPYLFVRKKKEKKDILNWFYCSRRRTLREKKSSF